MSIPNHYDVVQKMFAAFPDLLTGVNDENRREWTRRVAETLKAKCPAEPWGAKRADPGRPLSKDVIALDRNPLVGVELLIGAGTASPLPEWVEIDLTGQTFVPVTARDWLGGTSGPEPDPEPGDLEARVERLEQVVAKVRAALVL